MYIQSVLNTIVFSSIATSIYHKHQYIVAGYRRMLDDFQCKGEIQAVDYVMISKMTHNDFKIEKALK